MKTKEKEVTLTIEVPDYSQDIHEVLKTVKSFETTINDESTKINLKIDEITHMVGAYLHETFKPFFDEGVENADGIKKLLSNAYKSTRNIKLNMCPYVKIQVYISQGELFFSVSMGVSHDEIVAYKINYHDVSLLSFSDYCFVNGSFTELWKDFKALINLAIQERMEHAISYARAGYNKRVEVLNGLENFKI